MPPSPVPACLVPGCDQPRTELENPCLCEEPGCPASHLSADTCDRHSKDIAAPRNWLPSDGLIDFGAIDIVIHEDREVQLTWVEALIATATMLAAGHTQNETTRRLGYDPDVYGHGPLRGPGVVRDLKRAIAAIKGEPLTPPPSPDAQQARARRLERRRLRRRARTPEQDARRQREAEALRRKRARKDAS